ncbi:hypothetical protein C8R46DRAFT_1120985, partial [Mycena filopes]
MLVPAVPKIVVIFLPASAHPKPIQPFDQTQELPPSPLGGFIRSGCGLARTAVRLRVFCCRSCTGDGHGMSSRKARA